MSLHQSSHRQDSFDIVILIFILVFLGLCWYRFKKRKVYHDPLIKKIKYDVSQLDPRIETIEFYSSDESYTEDKKKIYICLRDESGEYYDYNMLMYVGLHGSIGQQDAGTGVLEKVLLRTSIPYVCN